MTMRVIFDSLNACASIVSIESGNSISSAATPWNAPQPMPVTDPGIKMSSSFGHPQKVYSWICLYPLGKITHTSPVQKKKTAVQMSTSLSSSNST